FALQAACWGGSELALLDQPPAAAMAAARAVLRELGALEERVTGLGRRMALMGVHPRLARALLELGAPAAEVVALLSEHLPREAGDDLVEVWRTARRGGDGFSARWRQEVRRLKQASDPHPGRAPVTDDTRQRRAPVSDDTLAGRAVALAFPERVARKRGSGYLMANGTRAELAAGSRLDTAEWLAIAVADRQTGQACARIRQAVVIDEETAALAVPPTTGQEVAWRDGDVVARSVTRLGAIELSSRPLEGADVREALLEGLRSDGVLVWSREALALKDRLAFCHRRLGEPWHPMDDLAGLADLWLEPELSRARRRKDLERIDVAQALRRLVPWSERLEERAPERIEVPSGSKIRIDYSGEQPVLAVKLQELFGWDDAPRICGVPMVIHLLSPAGRPAAITADLATFWREGYRAVRAELRGRYPKHPWPEDPLEAVASRGTKRGGA
ncbi:MAG: ATP-dependent helicase HrpB, partial [Thermoactinospora sp.]|nr:ATP-dependent helicase HrpB [Thermoactinospora sp.]